MRAGVSSSVMPKGVEHRQQDNKRQQMTLVSSSVMPKGVEHNGS